MVKQFCSVCTRPRGAGHPPPFGKNCRMPKLSTPERQRNIAEQQRIAAGIGLPSDENDSLNESFDSAEELAAQEAMLQQQKELLLKKKEEATKKLEKDKKLKEDCDRIKALRAEVEKMNQEVLGKLQESHSIHLEIQQELPGHPANKKDDVQSNPSKESPSQSPASGLPGQPAPDQVTTAAPGVAPGQQFVHPASIVPGVHNFAGARPKVPSQPFPGAPAAAAAALDPALQAYGQAYAAYTPGHPAVPSQQVNVAPGSGPGIGPQAWLQQQPLLGAAAGVAAAPSLKSTAKFGKCLPEYYIEQNASIDEDADKSRPSYYEFVHGVLTLLIEKHVKNHEPIDELLLYYEQIANFATSHRWSAVYKLHTKMCNEVKIGLRSWSQEIRYNSTFKCFNAESDLSLKKATSEKKQKFEQRPRAKSERVPPPVLVQVGQQVILMMKRDRSVGISTGQLGGAVLDQVCVTIVTIVSRVKKEVPRPLIQQCIARP